MNVFKEKGKIKLRIKEEEKSSFSQFLRITKDSEGKIRNIKENLSDIAIETVTLVANGVWMGSLTAFAPIVFTQDINMISTSLAVGDIASASESILASAFLSMVFAGGYIVGFSFIKDSLKNIKQYIKGDKES